MKQGKPLIDVLFPVKRTPHGGKRKGAGRPPLDPSGAKVKKTLWLTPAEIAHLERSGSVSEGVRRLVVADMQR